jgi:hypothetical protein
MTRHLAGLGIGLAAAPVVAFLFLHSLTGTGMLRLVMPSSPLLVGGGFAPLAEFGAQNLWRPMLELLAVAVLAGGLASSRRVSPVAPLAAGLPLVGLHLFAAYGSLLVVTRDTPASLGPDAPAAIVSGAFLLIGGGLVTAAMAPWRWRSGYVASGLVNRHALGVLIGLVALPVLWLAVQFSESNVGGPALFGVISGPGEFNLLVGTAAVILGALASARWISPLAAVIAGAPMFASGVFALLAPSAARSVIDSIAYSPNWQPATESLAASGWLVLLGGMLLVAGCMPFRWRQAAQVRRTRPGAPSPGSALQPGSELVATPDMPASTPGVPT